MSWATAASCSKVLRRHCAPTVRCARTGLKYEEPAMSVKELFDLTGRTALVTGGSRGLGLQIAEALGEQGARVALVARKSEELDAATAHLRSRLGIDALPLVCDLADIAAI